MNRFSTYIDQVEKGKVPACDLVQKCPKFSILCKGLGGVDLPLKVAHGWPFPLHIFNRTTITTVKMKEVWKPVEGFEGYYEVSNCGRVKSLDRVVTDTIGRKYYYKGKIIKVSTYRTGYNYVNLWMSSKIKTFLVHRLVALSFVPNPHSKPMVNHLDGVKSNNYYSNLEWCTRSGNEKHAFRIGLKSLKGERHSQAKLTKNQVLEIRNSTSKAKEIAALYGVSIGHIRGIKAGRSWKHI